MKASLQLKLSQGLTMTPQLQQAIRLLQLSSMELQNEIQEALESNMMLELDEEDAGTPPAGGDSTDTTYTETAREMDDSLPEDLPVDTAWEDIYEGGMGGNRNAQAGEQSAFENRDAQEQTLREHLLWQLNLTPTSSTDKIIATAVIDALDDDGYLACSIDDIRESIASEVEVDTAEIEAMLRLVQAMEPPGMAARDLRECLLIQLRQLPADTPYRTEAMLLVSSYLQMLGDHDYRQLMRRMKLDRGSLQQVVALVQSLNPKPGAQIREIPTQYIVPDVYVRKEKDKWKVELNTETIPQLRINSRYMNMIGNIENSSDNTSLKAHLQEARWFIKSLQSRSETLLRVATSIVERQRGFLEHGEVAMRPLVLHDVAENLGMHESTISRVTTRKYMHTPRGIFELKYFFSSHVSTDLGGTASSTAIRALIRKFIEAETQERPLSDSRIATLLKDQGINVARRTVAKYRESMAIPPSNERRRLL